MQALNSLVKATEGVAWTIIALAVAVVLYFAADREPPFTVLYVEPTEARAGADVTLRANVIRQTYRGCSAEYSRFLFDSSGARFDISHAITSAQTIAAIEAKTPGALVVSFRIPYTVAPGPANLQTVLNYKCNRTHNILPISVTVDMPFTVLPSP